MRKTIKFTKMQGAGNDYIYVDTSLYDLPHPGEVARLWSDRQKRISPCAYSMRMALKP